LTQVNQTGDLASLSYLSSTELATLSSLQALRSALYSPEFRSFIRRVTGCGPLSGTKQDMSVNSYRKGCHLLNHDDVIDTRRVSYIVYMPFSGEGEGGKGKEWKEEWGGALELYDVTTGHDGVKEPLPAPEKIIPPAWNQVCSGNPMLFYHSD
jgi:Rps23 Pro-64 3,4-dihydroxylase Tpa1-like proline 4-hydroxylase